MCVNVICGSGNPSHYIVLWVTLKLLQLHIHSSTACIHLLIYLLISVLYHPAANGYTSARASPGLLTVSNGNSLGKVVLAKSPPPPPSPQMVNSRKPDLRVITSQGGKSLMQMVSHIKLNLWSHKKPDKISCSGTQVYIIYLHVIYVCIYFSMPLLSNEWEAITQAHQEFILLY